MNEKDELNAMAIAMVLKAMGYSEDIQQAAVQLIMLAPKEKPNEQA